LIIHQRPDVSVRAVCEVLHRHELGRGWDGLDIPDDQLSVGEQYIRRKCDGSDSADLAHDLIAAARECAFATWTEPAEDYLGTLIRYLPAIGQHEAACNAEGHALFHGTEITETGDLRALLGTAWDVLNDPPGWERTIEAPRFATFTVTLAATVTVEANTAENAELLARRSLEGDLTDGVDGEIIEVQTSPEIPQPAQLSAQKER
jgi:hypothetical protein